MVNYYKILKVSPKASSVEIKSAYRRLARKHHPDVNKNSEKATEEFAKIAKAYEILSNPQERAYYDTQVLNVNGNGSAIHSTDSVFYSDNQHAQKLRQMAIERRYNEIVDQMFEAERKETLAWQKVIFPTVALFVSTCFVGIFRPTFFEPDFIASSNIFGKLVLLTLFAVGILHLIRRVRHGFERYTYSAEIVHDSILEHNDPEAKPFSRMAAIGFLIFGVLISLGIGFIIGNYIQSADFSSLSGIFSRNLQPEVILYPPIVVLLVDILHSVVSKLEI